jgi:hypothetical protein
LDWEEQERNKSQTESKHGTLLDINTEKYLDVSGHLKNLEQEGKEVSIWVTQQSRTKEKMQSEEDNNQRQMTQQVKPMSVSASLRLCTNFRTYKYCLCHWCYKKASTKKKYSEGEHKNI